MKIGIVGHGRDKFTRVTKNAATDLIFDLLTQTGVTGLVSGHSPMNGVDIWSEEIAEIVSIPTDIKTPVQQSWEGVYGFRARNVDIAVSSYEVHVIVVSEYPKGYRGRVFTQCYHCNRPHIDKQLALDHIKSGGCWTAQYAQALNKSAYWHIVDPDGSILHR